MLFDYDSESGRLTARQTISTLPPGFAGSNSAPRSWCPPTGGTSTPATGCTTASRSFPSGSDGGLTFVGEEWTRGNYPRSFAFDPTGRFLYCCNQRADAITVFSVDRATGALSFTGHYAPVGNPSIIVFLDLA